MKRFIFVMLIALAFCGGLAAIVAFNKVKTIEETVLNVPNTIELNVAPGNTLYKVKRQLSAYANIDNIGFRLWLKLNPEFKDIKAGVYEIPQNSKLLDVISMMNAGKVKQYSVTLLEGHTIKQWLLHLAEQSQLVHDITEQSAVYDLLVANNVSFCQNKYKSVEGCLLPNTYFYTQGSKVSDILMRAFVSMENLLAKTWPTRFLDIPIDNNYEALILASIIEKETAIESERSEIAGVFVNRLNKNMRLQTDPTVIYGIGDGFDGNITRAHLRTATAYNTYVIKGLPITPIAMPSEASIKAALQPALTDALYFVATGEGGHKFSTNLRDHNKAVRAYLNFEQNK